MSQRIAGVACFNAVHKPAGQGVLVMTPQAAYVDGAGKHPRVLETNPGKSVDRLLAIEKTLRLMHYKLATFVLDLFPPQQLWFENSVLNPAPAQVSGLTDQKDSVKYIWSPTVTSAIDDDKFTTVFSPQAGDALACTLFYKNKREGLGKTSAVYANDGITPVKCNGHTLPEIFQAQRVDEVVIVGFDAEGAVARTAADLACKGFQVHIIEAATLGFTKDGLYGVCHRVDGAPENLYAVKRDKMHPCCNQPCRHENAFVYIWPTVEEFAKCHVNAIKHRDSKWTLPRNLFCAADIDLFRRLTFHLNLGQNAQKEMREGAARAAAEIQDPAKASTESCGLSFGYDRGSRDYKNPRDVGIGPKNRGPQFCLPMYELKYPPQEEWRVNARVLAPAVGKSASTRAATARTALSDGSAGLIVGAANTRLYGLGVLILYRNDNTVNFFSSLHESQAKLQQVHTFCDDVAIQILDVYIQTLYTFLLGQPLPEKAKNQGLNLNGAFVTIQPANNVSATVAGSTTTAFRNGGSVPLTTPPSGGGAAPKSSGSGYVMVTTPALPKSKSGFEKDDEGWPKCQDAFPDFYATQKIGTDVLNSSAKDADGYQPCFRVFVMFALLHAEAEWMYDEAKGVLTQRDVLRKLGVELVNYVTGYVNSTGRLGKEHCDKYPCAYTQARPQVKVDLQTLQGLVERNYKVVVARFGKQLSINMSDAQKRLQGWLGKDFVDFQASYAYVVKKTIEQHWQERLPDPTAYKIGDEITYARTIMVADEIDGLLEVYEEHQTQHPQCAVQVQPYPQDVRQLFVQQVASEAEKHGCTNAANMFYGILWQPKNDTACPAHIKSISVPSPSHAEIQTAALLVPRKPSPDEEKNLLHSLAYHVHGRCAPKVLMLVGYPDGHNSIALCSPSSPEA